jgi:hypothetical protein
MGFIDYIVQPLFTSICSFLPEMVRRSVHFHFGGRGRGGRSWCGRCVGGSGGEVVGMASSSHCAFIKHRPVLSSQLIS